MLIHRTALLDRLNHRSDVVSYHFEFRVNYAPNHVSLNSASRAGRSTGTSWILIVRLFGQFSILGIDCLASSSWDMGCVDCLCSNEIG
jgi:hypothetical protein